MAGLSSLNYRRKMRALGRCVNCGKEAMIKPDGTKARHCRYCANKAKEYARQLRERRTSQGLCSKCLKNPVVEGYSRCQECIDSDKENKRIRKVYKC